MLNRQPFTHFHDRAKTHILGQTMPALTHHILWVFLSELCYIFDNYIQNMDNDV
jgi:hypothetical protein